MKLITETKGKKVKLLIKNTFDLSSYFTELNETNIPYIIVEDFNRNYIQVAGCLDNFVVEYRNYTGDLFKHYVIGLNPIDKTWCVIDSKVGNIKVMKNEVLDFKTSKSILQFFLNSSRIEDAYNKRNVTKLYV